MYHILGFIAVILGFVFIWTVGTYDYKLGIYFGEIYTVVILFFMTGLIVIAKRLRQKANERKGKTAKARSEDKGAKDNFGKELYLISKREGDTISYRVENEERVAVFDAIAKLTKGRVDSIKLCAQEPDAGADILVTRVQGAKEYTVWEGERILGAISVRKDGLYFVGAADKVCYSASFAVPSIPEEEEAVEGIMTLVTFRTFSYAKKDIVSIKGPDDEVVGKYFFALRNLSLTEDRNNFADRRVAVVLAIMADVKLQLTESRKPA